MIKSSALGLKAALGESIIDPFRDFYKRPGWFWVLCFILLYKYGDAIAGALFNPFFRELGFTGTQVALIVKTYGIPMTMLGVCVGGVIVARIGIFSALLLGGVAQAATNL